MSCIRYADRSPRAFRAGSLRPRANRPAELAGRRVGEGALVGLLATVLMTALLGGAPSLSGRAAPAATEELLALLRAHTPLLALALTAHLGYGALAGALFAVTQRGGG